MRNKAFTLIEIFVVIFVVGIMAVLALPYFQNVLERSKDEVCITNIEALKRAVDMQVIEEQVVPASLAAVPQKYIDAAYAEVWKKRPRGLKLARFILNREWQSLAYASNRFPHLRCPKNPDPDSISYGLNVALANKTAEEYKTLSATSVVVGDADAYVYAFCALDPAILADLPPGQAKKVDTSACSLMDGLIQARGHEKHGLLGAREKYAIGATGGDIIVNLKKN